MHVYKVTNLYKFILTVSVNLLFISSFLLLTPNSEYESIIDYKNPGQFVSDIIWFIVVSYFITSIVLFISGYFDRLEGLKKLVICFIIQSVAIIVGVTFIILLTDMLISLGGEKPADNWEELKRMLFVAVLMSVFILFVHHGRNLILEWRANSIKHEDIKKKALQWELTSLKLQLDQNFMFNNYRSLFNLIQEDREKALTFLEKLASTHRYLLLNAEVNLIKLKQELLFLKDLGDLIKEHYEGRIIFKINIKESDLNLEIPPVSLHFLVDHAIQSNLAFLKDYLQLFINIYIEEEYIVLQCQNLSKEVYDVGLDHGLNNIKKRYELLGKQVPKIELDPDFFIVRLILL